MSCKVKYKGVDMTYPEFATMLYNGELANLVSSGVLDLSKMKGVIPEYMVKAPESAAVKPPIKSSLPNIKYSKKKPLVQGTSKERFMTEDGKGNYVFFHYSNQDLSKKKIDPKHFGASRSTSREESSRTIPVSMYYTEPHIAESFTGKFKHAVSISKDKVYPFNEDPLNLLAKARKEFEKKYPGRAFTFNEQIGWVGKMAHEKGFEMIVADWGVRKTKTLRAETSIPMKPVLIEKVVGNSIEYKNPEYDKLKSNRKIKTKSRTGSNNSGAGSSLLDSLSSRFPNIGFSTDPNDFLTAATDPDSLPMYNQFGDVIGYYNEQGVYMDHMFFDSNNTLATLTGVWMKIAEVVDPAMYKAFSEEINKPENAGYIDEVEQSAMSLDPKVTPDDMIRQAMANMVMDASYARKNRTFIQKLNDFLKQLFGVDRNFMSMKAKDFAKVIAKEMSGNYPISTITADQLKNIDPANARIGISGGMLDLEPNRVNKAVQDLSSKKNLLLPQRFTSMKSMLSFMFGDSFHKQIRELNKEAERNITVRSREASSKAKRFAEMFKKEMAGKNSSEIETAIAYVNGIMSSRVKQAWLMQNSLNGVLSDDLVDLIVEMRDLIDSLSQEVNTHIDPSSRLSAVISGNLGFYMNRSYAVHKDGRWNKAMFPKGMNTAIDSKARSPKMQAVYDSVFNFMKTQYPNLTNSEVDTMLKTMAGLDKDGDFAKLSERGGEIGKASADFLQKRKDIPDEIRAFFGEYTDPLTNFYATVSNMISFAERMKFIDSISAFGKNKIFFDAPTGEYNTEVSGVNNYSAIKGMYTTPEIADLLSGVDRSVKIQWLRKIAAIWKLNATVLSPRSVMRNFYSNFLIHIANGNFVGAVTKLPRGIKYAYKEFRDMDDAYINRLVGAGVLNSGVNSSVLKKAIKDAYGELDNQALDPDDKYNSFEEKIKRSLSKALSKSADVYEAMDNIHRIMAFEFEMSDVKYMFPSLTKDELFSMAVERFMETNIVYDKAPDIVKRMSASPILGTFPTFTAEAMRIAVTIPLRAMKDISDGAKNKNRRQVTIGATRLIGYSAASVMINTIAGLIASGFEDDEDEELVLYEGAPEYAKNNTRIVISKTERGYKIVDLDWVNPFNFMQKAYNAYVNTGKFEPNRSSVLAATGAILEPFFGEEAILGIARDIISNEDPSGRDITSINSAWNEAAGDYLMYAMKRSRPGFVTSIDDFVKSMDVDPDYQGDAYKRTVKDETIRHVLGTNTVSVDIIRAFRNKVAKDFAPSINAYIDEYSSLIYKQEQDAEKMQWQYKQGQITKDQYAQRVSEMNAERSELAIELNEELIAKQVSMSRYAVALYNVSSEGKSPEEKAAIAEEIESKYEQALGSKIPFNKGFKVMNAVTFSNLYFSNMFAFDLPDDVLEGMGFVGEDAQQQYVKSLTLIEQQKYSE